ncbi:hypothetical protein D9757_013757 [Collybiopsis confluens]|uniref:NB-ARC domain-containing protein n=1 Tax=Collybiopsis confluens TaxID=2823264 RepID=A0A8H5FX92_9AGAR|nr:hypothetical protein D9757_013757 [Collybiopsis confluens]
MTANMFNGANNFQITGGQFHVSTTTTGSQPFQGPTITYQDIKLATPAAPTFFAGREKITKEAVRKLLQGEPAHLAILGAGGMGKTALALHIIKNAEVIGKFQDKIFFVPLQGLRLQVQQGKTELEVLDTYLATPQTPMLLVLDNFETPWNGTGYQTAVINFIDWLLDSSSLFVILTMRAAHGPGNKHWSKLGGDAGLPQLELSEARQMFLSLVHLQVDDSMELDWILGELDGMPLAVLLIARLQWQLNLGLEELGNLWKKHKTGMLKDWSRNETRLTSVSVSIDLSLQMVEQQNSDCERFLPVLSYLPNGLPAWIQHVDKLFPEDEAAVMSINQLLHFALLYQENNALKFVVPIQEYIQSKYPAEGNT